MIEEKITTGYSELRILLKKEIGVEFTDDGPAENHLGGQVSLVITGQNGGHDMDLWFNIEENGDEVFLFQQD